MRVRTPPPTRACEVCFTPVLVSHRPSPAAPRCDRHVDVVRQVPTLRPCPSCGRPTFREGMICTRCDPDVPPLRAERVANSRAPTRRMRPRPAPDRRWRDVAAPATQEPISADQRVRPTVTPRPPAPARQRRARGRLPFTLRDGRIVPELARVIAAAVPASSGVPRPVRGLLLNPEAGGRNGNRVRPGRMASAQRPAYDQALRLRSVPGEWEVLAFYRDAGRVKAAVWYLRHVVAPQLPAGRWEFARCPWEAAAVMGRYTPG